MTSYKLYKPLFLSLSLALAGCGGGGDDDETPEVTTPEVTTPESTLSVANPIADIELIFGEKLEFSIADDTCVDSNGADITYNLTLSNNVGLSLVGSTITSFTRLEGVADEIGVVSVTATCSTATDTLTDAFTVTVVESEFSPTVSLSFPLAVGKYNEDSLDMFGNVEAATGTTLNSVTVFVDDVETATTLNADKTAWRVSDVTIDASSIIDQKITVVADATITATSASIQKYEEVSLTNDLFKTTIYENISDIAVNDATDDIYVHSDGKYLNLNKFNLTSGSNSAFNYTRDATYGNSAITSIATDSENLYLSTATAVTKIDLSTNIETILSDINNGTSSSADPEFIFDINFTALNGLLYAADNTANEIYTIDLTTGDRNTIFTQLSLLSIKVNSATNTLYAAVNSPIDDTTTIGSLNATSGVYKEDLATIDAKGPITDFAINEVNNELFFVDSTGNLIKVALDTNTQTTIVTALFSVEAAFNTTSPLTGLHYNTERNVIIAAGRDADGTNKLLVIDPVSGDYAKVAAGTVDAD
ncbi:hypothetical protein GCM10008107_19850 [Psychrosphaera saromensis]|uniref:Dystroglycan-type cadherin-like domain-containing protein n=1 Tax=Psychrosphaera saromensis TaxID=716813 RepID=A0A2S7URS9_9GAMM|nr:hypothetical protein [Psychrosphaera saromensis]PQJ52686.1 hypothetical protein BTO11_02810 [Psychrosphaera saromensis]GHB70469.1 hypothetical protein GCM10008107_19850 [Psychrosphaera saromensis]GLQ13170.1 hypothetical protein GCM10007917_06250 [Psychrosphaera saromensis]